MIFCLYIKLYLDCIRRIFVYVYIYIYTRILYIHIYIFTLCVDIHMSPNLVTLKSTSFFLLNESIPLLNLWGF